MSNQKNSATKPGMTDALDKLYLELQNHEVMSDNFTTAVAHIETLEKLNALKKETSNFKIDSMLPVLGNLAGIITILGFERAHVITSKALSFVLKSKV